MSRAEFNNFQSFAYAGDQVAVFDREGLGITYAYGIIFGIDLEHETRTYCIGMRGDQLSNVAHDPGFLGVWHASQVPDEQELLAMGCRKRRRGHDRFRRSVKRRVRDAKALLEREGWKVTTGKGKNR